MPSCCMWTRVACASHGATRLIGIDLARLETKVAKLAQIGSLPEVLVNRQSKALTQPV
jgi:hypothetical protein